MLPFADMLIQRLSDFAAKVPDRISYRITLDGQSDLASLTYQALDQQARRVAHYLYTRQLAGKPVMVLFPAGLDFITTFLGCLYAGVVAVPVSCPPIQDFDKSATLIGTIADDAGVAEILAPQAYVSVIEARYSVATPEAWNAQDPEAFSLPSIGSETVAYLQYTSGSTSGPKGAIITHGNLAHSLLHTGHCWGYTQHSRTLTWAPHAHVYGLVCGLLVPIYHGSESVILPTLEFVKNPLLWLVAIDHYRVTHTGCPNFGYDLCVQHIHPADCQALDLSCWEVAVNGGEPVRLSTLDQFLKLCAPQGFKRVAFYPSYGMSEVTGLITTRSVGDISSVASDDVDPKIRTIPSLGTPIPGITVVVVNPENGEVLPDGTVGEIWLSGASVAVGYWQRDDESQATFGATLPGQYNRYCRTGDLGYTQNGDLFVTGRLKEMMIVYGKKYHSLDLEFACSHLDLAFLAPNSCIVFSVERDDKEVVIVLQETPESVSPSDQIATIQAIRKAISQTYQLDVYGVVLVPEQAIPRTSSGKLQRKLGRQKYLDNAFSVIVSDYKHPLTATRHQISSAKDVLLSDVGKLLGIPTEALSLHAHISEYGFDSITLVQFIAHVNTRYGLTLSPAVLFEYSTLGEFFDFLGRHYPENVNVLAPPSGTELPSEVASSRSAEGSRQDVAVIGISGRFPGANTVTQFWNNLKTGTEHVGEIPINRWEFRSGVGRPKDVSSDRVKWGGFIENVDRFDASFFNISRHEAELMDPQQRLFLETVWGAIEDAGYAPSQLAGTRTGIFVGVSASDYTQLMQERGMTDPHSVTGSVPCILANRISYLLDLKGPSEALDTACSSSLVAIHHAVQSLQTGDATMAIAGGVNLLLTPRLFQAFGRAQMLSPTGKCHTFDASADGYVRGEGVGAIVLKPLSQALADQDTIYGVIKGSAVNHGGYVKSLTVPNPVAQADVITQAIKKADIPLESISYIETHGTGTPLGDPIEINGLLRVFSRLSDAEMSSRESGSFCGLGSVKTNIGHLEAAAGIAGVIKVLLAMRHRYLPATLNFHHLNPYITLPEHPLYILEHGKPWERPSDSKWPRRAGVSSFGFGGVNAHIVLEEAPETGTLPATPEMPYFIGISAKDTEALVRKITDLKQWLSAHPELTNIAQLAYTLNTGRDHFSHRALFKAESIAVFYQQLVQWLENPDEHTARPPLAVDYCNGKTIDWSQLNGAGMYPKLSLPTYPFAGERYWLEDASTPLGDAYYTDIVFTADAADKTVIQTRVSGKNFIIKDHVFNKTPILPGVAYIEMARAAAELLHPDKPTQLLRKIVWLHPIVLEENQEITLYVRFQNSNGAEQFEIYSMSEGVKQRHAQGELGELPALARPERMPLDVILQRMPQQHLKADLYQRFFPKVLFEYGPTFQLIDTLHYNKNEVLAKIERPPFMSKPLNYILHPSLFDSGIQALIGMLDTLETDDTLPQMPFSLKEIFVYRPITQGYYLYAKRAKPIQTDDKLAFFDLTFMDETGDTLVQINGFTMRVAENLLKASGKTDGYSTMQATPTELQPAYFYEFDWQHQPAVSSSTPPAIASQIVFSDHPVEHLPQSIPTVRVTFGTHYEDFGPKGQYVIHPTQASDYLRLIQDLKARQFPISHLVYVLEEGASPEETLSNGLYSVFLLTQALLKSKVSKDVFLLFFYGTHTHRVPVHPAVNGFARTVIQENPHYYFRTVEVDDATLVPAILHAEWQDLTLHKSPATIRYSSGVRSVKVAKPLVFSEKKMPQLTQGACCVITGGLGGIGLIIARFLAEKYEAKLALIGRSPLTPETAASIAELEAFGSQVIYLQADVTSRQESMTAIETMKLKWGRLNAVFHCAGLTQDRFIIQKEMAHFSRVVAPKVLGTCYLDEATQHEPLDYFVLFSSVAGVLGNVGQSDYASANVFLDHFAQWRHQQVALGTRYGHSISINWPVWESGGLRVDDATRKWMETTKGFSPMTTDTALSALTQMLGHPRSQVAVTTGDPEKINSLLLPKSDPLSDTVLDQVMTDLKTLCAVSLKADLSQMDVDTSLEKYGLNSLIMLELLGVIDKKYGVSLLPTAFSEYPTLRLFAHHVLAEMRAAAPPSAPPLIAQVPPPQPARNPFMEPHPQTIVSRSPSPESRKIAVISVALRMPQSPSVEAFWDNLVNARRMIQMGIPKSRWDNRLYYAADKSIPMKTYADWGGFVDNVDLFDPDFFGISEEDAYSMDPQQRIMLELAQELFDRAGYTKAELSGMPVSVILGAGDSDYGRKFVTEMSQHAEAHQIVNRIGNMIASRISDFYNLTAFSHTLDAACSASLLAIHHACSSILTGDATMAIAGGCELFMDPNCFIGFSKAGTLSDDGYCYVFDERAKGFVMAEGFGLILLKDYHAAVRDGDQILATILATATNNDGKTVGITTPNGKAQKEAIQTALNRSHISPETITYLEAHGTGTLLGDPIEIKAASDVYRSYTDKKNFCAVASLKSNMGHSLRAAGVASVIKTVLALHHQFIPATLHCERPHPRFQFDKSPFYPITQGKIWTASAGHPRRAAVSSFGFGGTNVHAILEEANEQGDVMRRTPLPLTAFKRRSFWLGNRQNDRKAVLRSLALGTISSQLATQILSEG